MKTRLLGAVVLVGLCVPGAAANVGEALTAEMGQAFVQLKNGKATLTVAPKKGTVSRLIVQSPRDIGELKFKVTRGRNTLAHHTSRFQHHAIVEWPNLRPGQCRVSITATAGEAGKPAAGELTCKLIAGELRAFDKGETSHFKSVIAFAPVWWGTLWVSKGASYWFEVEEFENADRGDFAIQVLSNDQREVRAKGTAKGCAWRAASAEQVVVKMTAPFDWRPKASVRVREADTKPPIKPISIDMGLELEGELIEVSLAKITELETRLSTLAPAMATVEAEEAATFEVWTTTKDAGDLILELRDEASLKLLAWDDDSGEGNGARIKFSLKAGESRRLVARAHDPASEGTVIFKLKTTK